MAADYPLVTLGNDGSLSSTIEAYINMVFSSCIYSRRSLQMILKPLILKNSSTRSF